MIDFRAEREIKCRVQCIQNHLDAIKKLLQVQEPKPKSGTVVRLMEENRKLKQQVEQFRAGWCPFDCARNDQSDQLKLLKERNDKLEQNLITVEHQFDKVQEELNRKQASLEMLNERNDKLGRAMREDGIYAANLRKAVAIRDKQLAQVHDQLWQAMQDLEPK